MTDRPPGPPLRHTAVTGHMSPEPGEGVAAVPLSRRLFLRASATVGGSLAVLAALGCRRETLERVAGSGALDAARLGRLRDALDGSLLAPGDAGYEAARRLPGGHNPRTDLRPAVIVRCASADDVARALALGRETGLEIAVRGGGHDALGRSTCDGGVLADLGPMNAVDVDPRRLRASVGGGARVAAVDAALAPHGLAAALGCNPVVGIGGLTLGGGLGWLLGRCGAACDQLVAAEVVTSDGRRLRASEEEEPDLFWALRGGGGNFGVVTRFDFRLHPMTTVIAGHFAWRGGEAARLLGDFMRLYGGYMASAPDELAVEVVAYDVVPGGGAPVVGAIACHTGDERRARRDLAPLAAYRPSHPDAAGVATVRSVPYLQVAETPERSTAFLAETAGRARRRRRGGERPADGADDDRREGARGSDQGGGGCWRGASLAAWSDTAAERFGSCVEAAPGGWVVGAGHYQHGALVRVAEGATALPRRAGLSSYFFGVGWQRAAEAAPALGWAEGSIAAMAPHSAPSYVNYLSSDDEAAVAATYGDRWARLKRLKRRYDPDNVFHLNRNVPPAG